MYACDHLENGVLNAVRGSTFAAPAKVYLGLFLSDPGETGNGGLELSYPGYQRMELEFSSPAETSEGMGVQNLRDIKFPTPSQASGTVTHIGVLDSILGGNMLCRGELTEPLAVDAGQPPVILAGDVLFYLTGGMSRVWKTRVLNFLRGQSISGISPHLALWNGSPEMGGAELAGGNYARVSVNFGAPAEQPSGQVLISSAADCSFARPTTVWGVWTHAALYSAQTSGEPVFIQELGAPIELKRGYMPDFPAGSVTVGLN